VVRRDAQLLRHVRDYIGLADSLAARNRERLVSICAVDEAALDKMLARHLVHCAQYGSIADAALAQSQHELHAANAVVAGWLLAHYDPPELTIAQTILRLDGQPPWRAM